MKKICVFFLLSVFFIACKNKVQDTEKTVTLRKEAFEKEIDGKKVSLYSLKNKNGIIVYFTNYGARVVSLLVPDRKGKFADVVLGFDSIAPYLTENMYLGCIVGRYANRINNGKFTLDGKEYILFQNDGSNSLHGGKKGFNKIVWDVAEDSGSITFSYLSPDGEEGYPGNLKVLKKYTLTDNNELKIEYEAETDKATVVNLSHHGYFNLKGEGDSTILDHYLEIYADYITPVDSILIPTGELMPVVNTPFDFTRGKKIGQDIKSTHKQINFGNGYDHNWVLNKNPGDSLILAAKLWEETTGRLMEIYTTEPGIQFYSGNFMNGTVTGKSGKVYQYRAGLALETQHYPDSPNNTRFPSTVLRPGEKYKHVVIYKFGSVTSN